MSRGPEILSLAAKCGVHLRLEGSRIAWRADAGMDPTVERAIHEFRGDVMEELQRRAADEQRAAADYEARERLAQESARTRIANGAPFPRDEFLSAGLPIAEAERLAVHRGRA